MTPSPRSASEVLYESSSMLRRVDAAIAGLVDAERAESAGDVDGTCRHCGQPIDGGQLPEVRDDSGI